METRYIVLPRGGTLELNASSAFYDRLRSQFGLADGEPVDDAHVRMFLYGACKTAIDAAEREMLQDVARTGNT